MAEEQLAAEQAPKHSEEPEKKPAKDPTNILMCERTNLARQIFQRGQSILTEEGSFRVRIENPGKSDVILWTKIPGLSVKITIEGSPTQVEVTPEGISRESGKGLITNPKQPASELTLKTLLTKLPNPKLPSKKALIPGIDNQAA